MNAETAESKVRAALSSSTARQVTIAHAYADALALPNSEFARVDWRSINRAIQARWPKGLVRVKRMAWKEARLRGQVPVDHLARKDEIHG